MSLITRVDLADLASGWISPSSLSSLCVSFPNYVLGQRGQSFPVQVNHSFVKGIWVYVSPPLLEPTNQFSRGIFKNLWDDNGQRSSKIWLHLSHSSIGHSVTTFYKRWVLQQSVLVGQACMVPFDVVWVSPFLFSVSQDIVEALSSSPNFKGPLSE